MINLVWIPTTAITGWTSEAWKRGQGKGQLLTEGGAAEGVGLLRGRGY